MKTKSFTKQLITCFAILLGIVMYGQEKTVTGSVTDVLGVPLPGASVLVKGTTIGVQTDFDGNYNIQATSTSVLVFSYVGYIAKEVMVSNQETINVTLEENVSMLNEVVVTGYGAQSRATLTTSVSKLDTQILETSTRSNVATALQGTIAGLRVTNNTGQPGSTPSIVLRGGTTFGGGGNPLILIDGVPGSFFGLNADDVESIEVLKDAAATAIYGARSANGVILVTTKTGKVGKSSINYKYRFSVNNERNDQEFLGAEDFIRYNRQGVAYWREATNRPTGFGNFLDGATGFGSGNNTTTSPYTVQILSPSNEYLLNQPGWKTMEDPLNPATQLLFLDNNVSDNIYQTSYSKDHYLSFDGGNENGTYFLGLGALDNDGLILGSGFKRYSGKLSGTYKIKDNFRVNSTILYTYSNFNRSPLGSDDTVFRRFAAQPPTSRTFDNNPDGTLSDVLTPGTNSGFGNPLYYADKFVRNNLEQRLSAVVGFDWDIIENLKLNVTGSHFTVNNHNSSFNRAFRNGISTNPLNETRNASVSLGRTLRNQLTGTLNYKKKIGLHNFNVLLGTEYFKDNFFTTNAGTRNSPTDLIETLNAGAEAEGIPSSFESEYVLVSGFGRLLYDFDNKYLVSATFRQDGSSRLGNDKFGFFPGASIGWNVHNEDFFIDANLPSLISTLKPRFSYGVNGNQDVLSNYGVFGSYGSQGVYNGQTGYGNTSLATLNLGWERSTTINAGLDVSFFQNRLSLIADVYSRDIKDKLANLTLPYWTGFSGILTNNGTIRNKGFELELNADIIRNENLTWNVGASFTRNRNFVQNLPENDNDLNRQGGTEIYNPATGQNEWVGGLQEGQRVGLDLIVGFEQERIYRDQADADADAAREDVYLPNDRFQQFAGDVKWVDQNNDGVINELDRKVIGRTVPDILGGITSSLSYKNLNLFVKTDFAAGHKIWNHISNKAYGQTQGNLNQPISVLNSWTPTNQDTDLPRFVFVNGTRNIWRGSESEDSLQNFGNANFWEKGDYLALREVTLSYNVPSKYFNDAIDGLSIYVTGTNLHYFTSFKGDSPEQGGVQYGTFPMPRTMTLGLNLTF